MSVGELVERVWATASGRKRKWELKGKTGEDINTYLKWNSGKITATGLFVDLDRLTQAPKRTSQILVR